MTHGGVRKAVGEMCRFQVPCEAMVPSASDETPDSVQENGGSRQHYGKEPEIPVRPTPAPPVPSVNTKPLDASNVKQARIREAEEDRELIVLAQNGNKPAFRKLVERHQRRAFAIALSLVRDENDARELVQEAFLRVHKSLDNFQGSSSFFTWLYRIITNLSIDLIRKPGRTVGAPLFEEKIDGEERETEFPFLSRVDGSDPADVVNRRELAERLSAALEALPPYHRAVIIMREVDGLSYEEMAEIMNVSKGTIMSRLFHARQKLQRTLVDCYVEHVGLPPQSAPQSIDSGES